MPNDVIAMIVGGLILIGLQAFGVYMAMKENPDGYKPVDVGL